MITVSWKKLDLYRDKRPDYDFNSEYIEIAGILSNGVPSEKPIPDSIIELPKSLEGIAKEEFKNHTIIGLQTNPILWHPRNEKYRYVSFIDILQDGLKIGGVDVRIKYSIAYSSKDFSFSKKEDGPGIAYLDLILPLNEFTEESKKIICASWDSIKMMENSGRYDKRHIFHTRGKDIVVGGYYLVIKDKLKLELPQKPVFNDGIVKTLLGI